jgi:Creatinase/Prolidase N-terminal domain
MTSASASLTAHRRDRVLAAMEEADLDVLVLGRQDDANYASGMHRLWTAGTRPFGAGCIVVRTTGRTHVLSSWDAGIPDTMQWDDLYPSTWNPRIMAAGMRAVPGLTEARRIGVDEVSPSFDRAIGRIAPDAEVVPADDVMTRARRIKSGEEIERIRIACTIAWTGVTAALADPSHGVGAAIEAIAATGHTIPSSAPRVRVADGAVDIDLGVLVDGYEGGVGGRFADGEREPSSSLTDACVPGATHPSLASAARGGWLVRGLGMGFERPVIDPRHGVTEVLEAGMVLSVGDGHHRDVVAVTDDGPRILSTRP